MDKSDFERIKAEERKNTASITGPMNYFNSVMNEKITIVQKNKDEISGVLKAFDLYLNLTLVTESGEKFISGKNVMFVFKN